MTDPIIHPTAEQRDAFMNHERPGKIHMLNFLKYREQAEYQSGDADAKPCSGEEAYQRYGRVAAQTIGEVGGAIVWSGKPELLFIGDGEDWDQLILVEYPSADAFQQMMEMPHYQAATHHRQAGLAATKLIRCNPAFERSGN